MEQTQPPPDATPAHPSRVFVVTSYALVMLLASGLGTVGGGMIAGLYQFLQTPTRLVGNVGLLAGGVCGAIAGWFWARLWFGGFRVGNGAFAGLILGASSSAFTHFLVGPAQAIAHGRAPHWQSILGNVAVAGLPIGILAGAILGAFCGSLLQTLQLRSSSRRR